MAHEHRFGFCCLHLSAQHGQQQLLIDVVCPWIGTIFLCSDHLPMFPVVCFTSLYHFGMCDRTMIAGNAWYSISSSTCLFNFTFVGDLGFVLFTNISLLSECLGLFLPSIPLLLSVAIWWTAGVLFVFSRCTRCLMSTFASNVLFSVVEPFWKAR